MVREMKKTRRGRLLPVVTASIGILVGTIVVGTAIAQTGDDPVLVKELALRALGDGMGGGSVSLEPGRLPNVTPALVTPSGWRLLGTVSRTFNPQVTGGPVPPAVLGPSLSAAVHYDGTGTAQQAVDAFIAAHASGWRAIGLPSGPPSGGFVSPDVPSSAFAMLCSGDSFLNVNAFSVGGAPAKVSANVNTVRGVPVPPCAAGGPGTPPTIPPPSIPTAFAHMPRLALPAGAVVVNGGGLNGSMLGPSSMATVDRAPSVGDLERHFATQLQAQSWRRIGGSADPSAATSLWRKTVGEIEIQALLTVVESLGGGQRRDLTIQLTGPPGAPGVAIAVPVTTIATPVGAAPATTTAGGRAGFVGAETAGSGPGRRVVEAMTPAGAIPRR